MGQAAIHFATSAAEIRRDNFLGHAGQRVARKRR
jgi:hypothetical protein